MSGAIQYKQIDYSALSGDWLRLPDGRIAETMRRLPLVKELQRLKIAGVEASMSKPQLLACLALHLQANEPPPDTSTAYAKSKAALELIRRGGNPHNDEAA